MKTPADTHAHAAKREAKIAYDSAVAAETAARNAHEAIHANACATRTPGVFSCPEYKNAYNDYREAKRAVTAAKTAYDKAKRAANEAAAAARDAMPRHAVRSISYDGGNVCCVTDVTGATYTVTVSCPQSMRDDVRVFRCSCRSRGKCIHTAAAIKMIDEVEENA